MKSDQNSRIFRTIPLLAVVWCLVSSNAFAFMARMSYQSTEMIDQSDIICTAEVLSTQSKWKDDHRGRHIYTNVELLVRQKIKGNLQSEYINLEVVGGTVEDMTEIVSDTPVFTEGEYLLLFLRGKPLRVVGGTTGKVTIFNNYVFWGGHTVSLRALSSSLVLGRTEVFIDLYQDESSDDISIKPIITSIVPDIGSAGTGTEVTISGTGFGDTQDSGKVEFFYRDEEPKIPADIISWTDTQIVCTTPLVVIDGDSTSASSGPVTVTTSCGTSNGFPFNITFGHDQIKWPGINPVITYYVNENATWCETGGKVAAILNAIKAAAETWNNTEASFQFQYAGTHDNTDPNYNSKNELLWGDIPDEYLALTHSWIENGNLVECDVVFNDDLPNSYLWTTRREPGDRSRNDVPVYDRLDVETVALHEFGHWLRLCDLYGEQGNRVGYTDLLGDIDTFRCVHEYDQAKVMYGDSVFSVYLIFGNEQHPVFELKRDLHPDDVAGIHYIYTPVAPPIKPTQLEYPSSENKDGVYTITWGRVLQASSYELERSNDGGLNWIQVYTGPHMYFGECVGLGIYHYRIRACNITGPSEWETGTWDCIVNSWSGNGNENEPFLIYTVEDLNRIGSNIIFRNKYFKLMNDLDLSGYDGQDGRPVFDTINFIFFGTFDGDGYVISNFTSDEALFSLIGSGGVIKSLGLSNAYVKSQGGLVDQVYGNGTISNCWFDGTVIGGGFWEIGGLVGILGEGGTVVRCHSSGDLTSDFCGGGLVGLNAGTVIQCYSTATVNGRSCVGGLIGDNFGSVSNSFSTGMVYGDEQVGGLVGINCFGYIETSYSMGLVSGDKDVGGLVGLNEYGAGEIIDSFWDIEASNLESSAGGTGKTTAEMQKASTFLEAGWDFVGETANGTEDIWWILEGQDYPRLWRETEGN